VNISRRIDSETKMQLAVLGMVSLFWYVYIHCVSKKRLNFKTV